jgi:BON domain
MGPHAQPFDRRHEIRVQVGDQVGTRKGTVDSWQEKELAGEIVKGIRGLTGLNNEIDINYEAQQPDPQVAADIRQRLDSDVLVDASRIAIAVKDGNVSLSGEVRSAAEKSRAVNDAWVVGTHSVDAHALEVNPLFRNERSRPRYVYRTDEELRNSVRDALRYDPRVDPSRIRGFHRCDFRLGKTAGAAGRIDHGSNQQKGWYAET